MELIKSIAQPSEGDASVATTQDGTNRVSWPQMHPCPGKVIIDTGINH